MAEAPFEGALGAGAGAGAGYAGYAGTGYAGTGVGAGCAGVPWWGRRRAGGLQTKSVVFEADSSPLSLSLSPQPTGCSYVLLPR